jgi:hypothetical protein
VNDEDTNVVSNKLTHEIPNQEEKFIPNYKGQSNAFAIQLFCIEEKYESRSLDFLPKAFDLFPHKDYCVITLPHTVPEFALIQNFFVSFDYCLHSNLLLIFDFFFFTI